MVEPFDVLMFCSARIRLYKRTARADGKARQLRLPVAFTNRFLCQLHCSPRFASKTRLRLFRFCLRSCSSCGEQKAPRGRSENQLQDRRYGHNFDSPKSGRGLLMLCPYFTHKSHTNTSDSARLVCSHD